MTPSEVSSKFSARFVTLSQSLLDKYGLKPNT